MNRFNLLLFAAFYLAANKEYDCEIVIDGKVIKVHLMQADDKSGKTSRMSGIQTIFVEDMHQFIIAQDKGWKLSEKEEFNSHRVGDCKKIDVFDSADSLKGDLNTKSLFLLDSYNNLVAQMHLGLAFSDKLLNGEKLTKDDYKINTLLHYADEYVVHEVIVEFNKLGELLENLFSVVNALKNGEIIEDAAIQGKVDKYNKIIDDYKKKAADCRELQRLDKMVSILSEKMANSVPALADKLKKQIDITTSKIDELAQELHSSLSVELKNQILADYNELQKYCKKNNVSVESAVISAFKEVKLVTRGKRLEAAKEGVRKVEIQINSTVSKDLTKADFALHNIIGVFNRSLTSLTTHLDVVFDSKVVDMNEHHPALMGKINDVLDKVNQYTTALGNHLDSAKNTASEHAKVLKKHLEEVKVAMEHGVEHVKNNMVIVRQKVKDFSKVAAEHIDKSAHALHVHLAAQTQEATMNMYDFLNKRINTHSDQQKLLEEDDSKSTKK